MEDFVKNHKAQLDVLNIPDVFFPSIKEQLERSYVVKQDSTASNGVSMNQEAIAAAGETNLRGLESSDIGAMLAIPHLCSWDMLEESNTGLWDALSRLSVPVLQEVLKGLKKLWMEPHGESSVIGKKEKLLNQICDPRIWSRVILYKSGNQVRGALPAPPFLLQVDLQSETDGTEGDLSGPFPFQYHPPTGDKTIDCSLAYLNPGINLEEGRVPTIDFCPSYGVPNAATRCVRYAALLGIDGAPTFAIEKTKEMHANFVHQMHLVRQQQEGVRNAAAQGPSPMVKHEDENSEKIWKIYTDTDDHIGVAHPEAGLSKEFFALVDDPSEADFIYSCRSLFTPGLLNDVWKKRAGEDDAVLINQFPYEGAFLQKDHLGRETLKQHGLPRPNWAIETYDLDVQFGEFAGSALLEMERNGGKPPVWIVKPATGTRSQGHVVTKSLGQVLRLIDAGGVSRVAQRYIENPVSYKGRKVDCRCYVMMTSAAGSPTLYTYNRTYFRIAAKQHCISSPSDLMDHKSVLSAMYFVPDKEKDPINDKEQDFDRLPIDTTTIAQLEADYGEAGFRWKESMLPKIQTLVRELFSGMAAAYPAMGESNQYRALYGVDLMFSIQSDGSIEPKLTEVSFCPANLAISKEYEHSDEENSFLTDVFKCLLAGEVSENITKL